MLNWCAAPKPFGGIECVHADLKVPEDGEFVAISVVGFDAEQESGIAGGGYDIRYDWRCVAQLLT